MKISKFATGVEVSGNGAFKMTGGGEITGNGNGAGVSASGDGDVTLEGGVTISNVQTGVSMEGTGGTLIMKGDSTISLASGSNYGVGVYVGSGVTSASLARVTIEGRGGGTGIYAVGTTGMMMTLDDVKISRVEVGVKVEKGIFKMDGGSVTEFTEKGVSVGSGVKSASLARVKIEGKGSGQGTGIYAAGGETVTLTEVTISRVQTGVYAEKGTFKMDGGEIKEFTGYGVSVGENVTSAELTRVKIEGKGSGQGTGVHAKGGETVTLNEVKISKVRVGVDVEKGTLIMKGESTISLANGNSYGVGVYVGDKVESATLMGTTITGQNKWKGEYGDICGGC
ncbi:right-handed parallel beta-helix repeat-containing protein [Bartonella schoenbuchensis]|uniref:Right handed beta helix domain-containing protein n=1 Tax=Bartonella schoenbuchensis m07a TaxID=1094496 RepID=N6VDG7_9HYPH|nr:right-handed parallel beta-helix repeat-containing protein [Bartonella schoenbuchensis]ENN91336.1 hypothetical protein m07a_02080 [Bartonella schoenbuchensis m07a]